MARIHTYDGETCMGMMCGGDDPPAGGWEGQFFGDADILMADMQMTEPTQRRPPADSMAILMEVMMALSDT